MRKLFTDLGKDVSAEVEREIQGYLDKITVLERKIVELEKAPSAHKVVVADAKPKMKVVIS